MSGYSTTNHPPCMAAFKQAVETGKSPQEVAALFHQNGVLKGTVANEVVQGRDGITDYFVHFTNGKNDVSVTFNTLHTSPAGSYWGGWTFAWTDDEGAQRTLDANYTFEPSPDNEAEISGLHSSIFFEPKS